MATINKPAGHGCETGAAGDDKTPAEYCDGKAQEDHKRAHGGHYAATTEFLRLKKACRTRLAKRGLADKEEYAARLAYELEQIDAQGATRYLVELLRRCRSEGVQFENENGLLVEWLLDITPQDPIECGLAHQFRFVGDCPDVDLDFDSARKPEVESYLKDKYGKDHVVHIGAYGTFSAKSAVKEMARVHGLMETGTETEMWFSKFAKDFDPFEPVSKESVGWNLAYVFGQKPPDGGAPPPPSPWTAAEIEEGLRFREQYRNVFDLASRVVGQITHFGSHAAGVGIFPSPAWLHVPLKRGAKGVLHTAVQEGTRFKEITQAGIIKIDILGLTLNSVMAMAIRLVKERHGKDLVDALLPKCPAVTQKLLDAGESVLDINDAAILEEARKGHNIGSFQFSGHGISSLLKRIYPESFEDIVAANALYRPGTIRAGEAEAFAWRKARTKRRQLGIEALSAIEKKVLSQGYVDDGNGKRKPRYTDYARMHRAFEELLQDTHGSLVYQEQVMKTFFKIAGFSMQEADTARKTLLKASQAPDREERLAALSAKVSICAAKQGLSEGDVSKLISVLANFSGYSFNKSHSASYAMAYMQIQFLKRYYPIEFLAALLSFSKNTTAEKKREDDPDIHLHIQEAHRLGVRVVRPLCNRAQADFTIHKTDELADHLSLSEADARSNGGEVLMWGLQHLMHIGERQAAEITAIYPVSDLDDFCDRVNGRVVNKNVIANLIRLGFFDCLYEDESPEMRRVLAWRHYHERQGMMTIQAAVQQVHAEYQDIKDRMAPLTLAPANLAVIEALEARAREKAKELLETGTASDIRRLHQLKRDRIARLDPKGERKTLKSLLRGIEKCGKMKTKLKEKRDSIVYKELVDDVPNRVEVEREMYGQNLYTNAMTPYMPQLRELVKWTIEHVVTIPEALEKVPPARRKCMTVIGELQHKSVRKYPYSDRSGNKKMRLVGKLIGRRGQTIDLVAFDVGDDMWTAAKGSEQKVVAVTGSLGQYRGSPQINLTKRTEWLRRSGVETFDVFEQAFKAHYRQRGAKK